MYEVEIKLRADHGAVRARLDEVGAERIGRVEQADTYYDAPHRSFAETDEALRVRRTVSGENEDAGDREKRCSSNSRKPPTSGDMEASSDASSNRAKRSGDSEERSSTDSQTSPDDSEARLTYKGPLVEAESKTREEFETRVADGETAAAILDGLGFAPAATVEKERERYRFDGATVTLDSVEGLGEFVEVEREAEESDVERVREGVRETIRALGLDPDEQVRTSYLGLLLDADESQ